MVFWGEGKENDVKNFDFLLSFVLDFSKNDLNYKFELLVGLLFFIRRVVYNRGIGNKGIVMF